MGMLYEYSQEDQAVIAEISARPTQKEIHNALAGAVGLIQLLGSNIDVAASVRRSMLTNHRFIEAQRILGLLERS